MLTAAGQSVIDLGSNGKLIAPVQVEGAWYFLAAIELSDDDGEIALFAAGHTHLLFSRFAKWQGQQVGINPPSP